MKPATCALEHVLFGTESQYPAEELAARRLAVELLNSRHAKTIEAAKLPPEWGAKKLGAVILLPRLGLYIRLVGDNSGLEVRSALYSWDVYKADYGYVVQGGDSDECPALMDLGVDSITSSLLLLSREWGLNLPGTPA